MKKETLRTIFYALDFLQGVNSAILNSSTSSNRTMQAYSDIERDKSAKIDLTNWVNEHRSELE